MFGINGTTTITPPGGMNELGEAASNVSGQSHITIESADTTQPIAGATGSKTATAAAGDADRTNAQLITLRPAAGGTVTTTKYGSHVELGGRLYIPGLGRFLQTRSGSHPESPEVRQNWRVASPGDVADAIGALVAGGIWEFGVCRKIGGAMGRACARVGALIVGAAALYPFNHLCADSLDQARFSLL